MNLHTTSEYSLYQLTQEFPLPPQPLAVSPATLHSLVRAFIDLLIEQQLAATLWVKLPTTDGWREEIERYQQQGRPEIIYLCQTSSPLQHPSPQRYQPASQIIPIDLASSPQLERESFLAVLSPQLCGLILAQQPAELSVSQPQLKAICTFEPPVLKRVFHGIREAIAITDSTPETLLTDLECLDPLPSSPDSALLAYLLLKQVQRTEAIVSSPIEAVPTPSNPTAARLNTPLHLNDEFLTNLVGELRPLLTNMKTALRLLQSKQIKPDQRQRYLELLHRECDRQTSLMAGLLELIELDRSLEGGPVQPVQLQELIPGLVSTYQPLAEEKGIQLGYTIPAGLPPVACSSSWLRQIFLNLLANSLKFTPPRGRVFVQASLQQEYIALTVSDTGIGIANSELPKIFNSVDRGRAINGEENTGAGLGLTIVKQLLQLCGGSISASSALGQGSTFKVLLPVAPN